MRDDKSNASDTQQPLNYRVRTSGFSQPGLLKTESITRRSPDGTKLHQVILFYRGKEGAGPPAVPTNIKIATYSRSLFNKGWYLDRAIQSWNGSYTDSDLLRDVLNDKFPDSGHYQLLTGDASIDSLAQKILAGEMPVESAEQILQALIDNPEAQEVFKQSDASQVFADSVNQFHQRQAIIDLESVATNPKSTEPDLQKILEKQWWMFGGRYIDLAKRRGLTVLDQLDVPLIRGDGALHIVELKQANIPKLVRRHRNHIIVGDSVHEAVAQSMNYLVALDEQTAQILKDLQVDVKRASVTVVIGHADFTEGFTPEEVHETLRTYNSHLSRIEVITYDELIAGAKQSMNLSS
ncbi:MAG: Shedu anti-phage system protein SduA domain-containing protein [Candidatus Saccharimonadota bacterium]